MSKYCVGCKKDIEEFFPGFLCPACQLNYEIELAQAEAIEINREVNLDKFLADNPEILRRASRDYGTYGA